MNIQLTNTCNTSINLSDFIPSDLARSFEILAIQLNVKSEILLTTVLTAMSSLYRTGTKITLYRPTDFRVSPNLFAAIVTTDSADLKMGAIVKNLIIEPFKELRQNANDEYDRAKEEYDKSIAYYKVLKGEEQFGAFPEGPPESPLKRQHYFFDYQTVESIYSQFAAFPLQGMCYLPNELISLFKPCDDDDDDLMNEEDLLSLYDEEAANFLFSDGTHVNWSDPLLSIFGLIPHDVFKYLQSNENTQWVKFLLINQPLAAATLSGSDSDEKIFQNSLKKIYLTIDNLPQMQFYLSKDAQTLFALRYNDLEQQRIKHPNPMVRAIIGKTIGRIGKLAVNLHCLNAICENQEITEVINEQALKSAIDLSLWFAQQALLLAVAP